MARRYFEDITDGEPLHCQKLIITREDIIEFAKRFDPQPFHTDENAAVVLTIFLIFGLHRHLPAAGELADQKLNRQSIYC